MKKFEGSLSISNERKAKRKWFFLGGLSVSLIGAGLCMAIESAFIKHNQPDSSIWVLYGTLSLIVFIAGICLFGEAVITRIKLLQSRNQ